MNTAKIYPQMKNMTLATELLSVFSQCCVSITATANQSDEIADKTITLLDDNIIIDFYWEIFNLLVSTF